MRLFGRLCGKWKPSGETIIREYGAFIERNLPTPLRIEDVSALPHPKDTILSAMLDAVVPGNNAKNDLLLVGIIHLAQFQLGVGPEALHQGGFDLIAGIRRQPASNDLAILRAEMQAIVAKGDKLKGQAKRFEAFDRLVQQDLALMEARLELAAKVL